MIRKGNTISVETMAKLILVMLFVAVFFTFLISGLETGESNLIDAFTQGLESIE